MSNNTLKIIITIGIYLVSTAISYSIFSTKTTPSKHLTTPLPQTKEDAANDYQAITFKDATPKTEECPINGKFYSKQQQKWWETHRPLGIMIENHKDARPQSGIADADVTYEAIAESGITRTLNVYYCQDAGIVGPIRSARTYFLDFISEYGDYPLYAHVGGANTPGPANALGQIQDYGWGIYNDLNQFSIGFPTFWRDQNRLGRDVATEHTMYSTTSKLWTIAQKRGLTNVDKENNSWNTNFVKYSFKDDNPLPDRPDTQTIHLEFWDNETYFVDWQYDKQNNLYSRKNGAAPHIDRNTNKQLSANNILVLFMTEKHANDGYENNAHLLYGTRGKGKALIFIDGKQVVGTWEKTSRTDRTILMNTNGEEIKFNRGKIWFEIMPIGSIVKIN